MNQAFPTFSRNPRFIGYAFGSVLAAYALRGVLHVVFWALGLSGVL